MPLDPDRVVALSLLAVAVIAVPGPSVLFVVSRGVSLGRAAGLITVLGNETGLLLQVSAVALGLGVIVERSILVYTVIKLVGAGYLVYLGIEAVRHRKRLGVSAEPRGPGRPLGRIFTEGVVVGATNPKVFLLFAAILPQFIDPSAGRIPLQLFLLGLVCVLIALVCDNLWAVLAGAARAWFGRSSRRLELISGGAGAVMIGLGVRVAVSDHPS